MASNGTYNKGVITLQLKGFDELERKLRALGPKIATNGLRAANRAGAVVFRDAAKEQLVANGSVRTGTLYRNIIVYAKRESIDSRPVHAVGIRGKNKRYKNSRVNRRLGIAGQRYRVLGDAYYGRFVELGTSRMAAKPFLRPAFAANVDKAIEAVRSRLEKIIEREAKKNA